jgi:hypothetical protein
MVIGLQIPFTLREDHTSNQTANKIFHLIQRTDSRIRNSSREGLVITERDSFQITTRNTT